MTTIYGKEVSIVINEKCNACGLCVSECPCEYLEMVQGKVRSDREGSWGCLTCGHCAAICPEHAVSVESDGISDEDILEFSKEKKASYGELFRLMANRRSIRKFKDQPVSSDTVHQILEAAQQAPAGLPPSTVKAVVLEREEKVRAFAFDFLDETARMSWMFSKIGVWTLRPFMSGEEHKDFREAIVPIYKTLMQGRREEKDFLFYDAPLAMIFAGTGDAADSVIACTYAMLVAESLGLGACMIGTVVPMLPRVSQAFRDQYQITKDMQHGLAIIFGYSQATFQRGIRRRFAGISLA